MGRTIAIGDIHGCADALHSLLDEIQPTYDDTIITLGDYVDRGPASRDVIDILIDLVSYCRFFPLLGNHELMMAAAYSSRVDYEFWLQFGGRATLMSYGGDIRQIPAHHRTFLNHCKRFHETDSHFFLHASYEPDLSFEDQLDEVIFWQHVGDEAPEQHYSKKIGIVGHTPQDNGAIKDFGHLKIIDTFCYGDGWLSAYDVESGELWQARMDGMLRSNLHARSPGIGNGGAHTNSTSDATVGQNMGTYEASQAQDSTGANLSPNSTSTDVIELDEAEFEQPEREAQIENPLELSGSQFKDMLGQVTNWLSDFIDELPDAAVHPGDMSELDTSSLCEPPPEKSTELQVLLNRIFTDYVPDSFNTTSPGYLAYIPGGGIPEAAIADLVAQITNRFVTVWNATPKFSQIEATVVRWFCDFVGYGEGAGGYLSSGGSTANQTAIVTARVKLLKNDFSKATIYASDQSHHCLKKSAFLAGIPKENFREIATSDQFQIDANQLREQIERDVANGFLPFLLVGNAGTTNTGAVDDLIELRKVADEYNLWFHVDAAYGGFFCLTEKGRVTLSGMETADSVVLDPHKGLFMPYGTGCLLVKNASTLIDTHSFTSDYMPQMTGDMNRVDFCEISPELSRGNRSLRLWLPFKHHGVGVFRELLEEKLQLAEWTHQQLMKIRERMYERLEIVAEPQLSILAFRLVKKNFPDESNNRMNQRWLEEINASGRVMLTGTMLNGKFVIRICILSFRTHLERMQECVEIIEETGKYIFNSQVS